MNLHEQLHKEKQKPSPNESRIVYLQTKIFLLKRDLDKEYIRFVRERCT